jgi:hypothetical protein
LQIEEQGKALENFKELASFADRIVGHWLSAWGCFTVIFMLCLPLIFLAAFIKWLFAQGFFG